MKLLVELLKARYRSIMSKPIIAVDIDDVLSRTADKIIAYGNKTWGHIHTLDDFTEKLQDMWQVDESEAQRRWLEYMDSGVFETYDVIPQAKDVLRYLSDRYRIIAVTSRRVSLMGVTEEWLAVNYAGIIEEVVPALIFGEGKKDSHLLTKAEVLQKVAADYHIDDQPKHCIGAASVGITGILYGGYPWNRDVEIPDGVVRCDDWQAIKEYFDGR